MGQVVIAGPERRRRWAEEERLSILAEAFAPGACVADVARRGDVSTSLIYTWRRRFLGGARRTGGGRDGARVCRGGDDRRRRDASSTAVPAILVDVARGRRVSILASASPAQVTAVLKALR